MRRLLSGFAFAACAPMAGAQVTGDPDVIQALMQQYGLIVEQKTDSSGDPKLESRLEGTRFAVFFYDCDGRLCDSIQFTAGFDKDKPMDMGVINTWNREKRYGKAFLDDEGDPFVEIDILLSREGIGAGNFDDVLDLWRDVLGDFRATIDW